MKNKSRYSKCYLYLSIKARGVAKDEADIRLMILILKEKYKKEFGIKSLKELSNKKLIEFEDFLNKKI